MMPTTNPPIGGMSITHGPRWLVVGPRFSREIIPRKARLVTRAIRRWSACAMPAATRPTSTARAQTYTVRFVTLAACGAMCAAASPGPNDGATGSPSVVEPVREGRSATDPRASASRRGSGPAPDAAPLTLEEHGAGRGFVDTHLANHPLQEPFQLLSLRSTHPLQGLE